MPPSGVFLFECMLGRFFSPTGDLNPPEVPLFHDKATWPFGMTRVEDRLEVLPFWDFERLTRV